MLATMILIIFPIIMILHVASKPTPPTLRPTPKRKDNYCVTVAKMSKQLANSSIPTEDFDKFIGNEKIITNAKRIRKS